MTFIHITPWAYYNDFDEKTCDWLEELIRQDCIAPGFVDRRSILEVQPDDLREFRQVHFFAGIGGWSYALRLIGWPDEAHVWTGSPPCQPFSSAGRQKGKEDERHLAPKFASLVWACRPGLLFGEQVASAEVFGKAPKKSRNGAQEPPQWAWLDDLLDRLEAARYAVGASDLPSASIGAPHIRQRTHFGAVSPEWLADAQRGEWGSGSLRGLRQVDGAQRRREAAELAGGRDDVGMADSIGARLEGHGWHVDNRGEPGWLGTDATGSASACCGVERMGDSRGATGERNTGTLSGTEAGEHRSWIAVDGNLPVGFEHAGSGVLRMADAQHHDGRSEQQGRGSDRGASDARGSAVVRMADADGRDTSAEGLQRGWEQRQQSQDGRSMQVDHGGRTGPLDGPWRTADWLFCRDAKWRPVEARPQQMANWLPVDLGHSGDLGGDAASLAQEEIGFPLGKVEYARATRLRGYGNAINPWLAAEFIASFLDALRGGADELSGQSPLELSKVRQRDLEDLL